MIKVLKKLIRIKPVETKPVLTWEQLQDRVRKNNHDWLLGRGDYVRK